jgi:glucose uptake protein GlcU
MNDFFRVETYLPDRPPTWLELFQLAVTPLAAFFFFQRYSSLSLPAVGLGFVGVMLLVGPASQTPHGRRVDEWEPERVQRLGLSVAIVVFSMIVITVFSRDLFFAVLFGGDLSCALWLAGHVLRDRQIEGLLPPEYQ